MAGDELHVDVELTSVRRIAGRDLITVTNTFTDTSGERVHTLHTTVVGLTAEDLDPAIKTAVQKTMMHDVDIFGVGEEEYHKTERQAGGAVAEGGTTRTPGTPSFDDVAVGDKLSAHHTRLSRGDLVNYAGVAGDANPIHWDEDIAKLAGLPVRSPMECSPWVWVPDSPPHGPATRAVTRYACGCLRPRSCRPLRAQTSSSAAGSVAGPGDAHPGRHRRREVGG